MPVNVLERIYASKAAAQDLEMMREPYEALRSRALKRTNGRRPFLQALCRKPNLAVVAEVKRASPSAGLIAKAFDPRRIARDYEAAGAAAISVLTEEEHFLGSLSYLDLVRSVTSLPLLRKDFLWTRYQVAQSAARGADCILLILAGIDDGALHDCLDEARRYALDVLVEVHDEADLARAKAVGADLIGINNRDLRTFAIDLGVSERLLPSVPSGVFAMSESGIRCGLDAARVRRAGARGLLIGESLMRAADPGVFIAGLTSAIALRKDRKGQKDDAQQSDESSA